MKMKIMLTSLKDYEEKKHLLETYSMLEERNIKEIERKQMKKKMTDREKERRD